MNLLAIVGSARKGKATDTLVDKAVEGVQSISPDGDVKKLFLNDHDIQYCRNCLACRDSQTKEAVATCTISDDMDAIREDVLQSDALILIKLSN